MRQCKLCPATITRRFAILCAQCCKNVTHDVRRAREILGGD
jgi:hypothetical protein